MVILLWGVRLFKWNGQDIRQVLCLYDSAGRKLFLLVFMTGKALCAYLLDTRKHRKRIMDRRYTSIEMRESDVPN